MADYQLKETEQLRIIYQEIISGCSVSSNGYYVRHLNELDHIDVLRRRISLYNKYIAEGIPSEQDRLKELIANEEWSPAQEEKILELKYNINDNEKNIQSLIFQQQAHVRDVIKQKKQALAALLIERQNLLGLTADDASERDTYNYLVFATLYKDKAGTQPLFTSFEDFENLHEDTIQNYTKEVESKLSQFRDDNVRKISVMSFFLNPFSYSKEAVHTFLSKPIVQFTHYQMLLFSMGTRNLNILSQAQGEPPELMEDIPIQKVLDWYDQQFSIAIGKRNASKS